MLKEITMFEFHDFAMSHKLLNPYQTSNYAIFKGEENYDYEYIGYFENNTLIAAVMILYKNISLLTKYAYAPRGYLLDFQNTNLLQDFTIKLKKYLNRKNVIFLKLDPLVITNEYNPITKEIIHSPSLDYKKLFMDLGYRKLKDNLYFEASLPRFDAYINLKEFNLKSINKNTRNKINNSLQKGLELVKASQEDLKYFYEFMKKKKDKNLRYYNDLYKAFNSDNLIDLFLVKVDYEKVMANAKNLYEDELEKNNYYNELLKKENNNRNLNKKMASDRLLIKYKNAIMEASRKYTDNELQEYIAGALVIKNGNKVNIMFSGFNPAYRHLNVNYFLHYSLIEYYKESFKYLGLNGLSGDFSKTSKYYGLNEFKLGFNPRVFEYLGELDLVINEKAYNKLLATGKLHQMFDKPKG